MRYVQFVNKCLRDLLQIKWSDKTGNEKMWRRTGQNSIANDNGQRRWLWIGHTVRKVNISIDKRAVEWNPQGTRKRRWLRGTSRRMKDKDLERSEKSWNGLL